MALKKLSSEEMITLTGPWIDEHHAEHKALAAFPEVRALLPRVATAHNTLVRVAGPTIASGEDSAIVKEQKALDDRHDNLARGLFYVLLGCAFLTRKPKESSRYLALQQFLLPEGIRITQKSYREEAGHGELLAKAIKSEHKKELAEITVGDVSLRDAVDEWLSVSKKLGELEDTRTATPADATHATPQADILVARNKWIRAVTAVISALDLVEASDATSGSVLSRFREAERRAERRASGTPAVAATDPTPTAEDATKKA